MQEADRDRLDAALHEEPDGRIGALAVEGLDPFAVGRGALRDRPPQGPRNEGSGEVEMDVVEVVELFVADLDDVAEAAGRQHPGASAGALDEGVRGEGRRVHDDRDAGRVEPLLGERPGEPREHRLPGVTVGGEHLAGGGAAGLRLEKADVGEGPPDVRARDEGSHRAAPG